MPLPDAVLATWNFSPGEDGCSLVLPDGCRDLILRVATDGCPQWFMSELPDCAYEVGCRAGEVFVGYRFHPGAEIGEAELLEAVAARAEQDASQILALIDDHVRPDRHLAEALEALAGTGSITEATRQLGVSERSLERLVKERTGRAPGYWKSLARIRRAAVALSGPAALADIALEQGYSDQAHMSREFRRWFGITPSRFRNRPDLQALAADAGYI